MSTREGVNKDEEIFLSEDDETQGSPHVGSTPNSLLVKIKKLGLFDGLALVPFLSTGLWLLCCLYINSVSQVYLQKQIVADPRFQNITLPDLGYSLFGEALPGKLPDIFVITSVILTAIRFGLTRMRWTILRRFLLLLGVIFIMRAFSINATILPNPDPQCTPVPLGNPFWEGLRILTGQLVTCGDMMFSGHTVLLTYCALIWQHYSSVAPFFGKSCCLNDEALSCYFFVMIDPNKTHHRMRPCTIPLVIYWCGTVTGYLLIIATRLHYTSDVTVGFWLGLGIWKLYHNYFLTAHTRPNLFNGLIVWMESESVDYNSSTGEWLDPIVPVVEAFGCSKPRELELLIDK